MSSQNEPGIPQFTITGGCWKHGFAVESLFQHSVDMITVFGLAEYDPTSNTARLPQPFGARFLDKDKKGASIIGAWLCFSVGVECLLKAVLLRHETPIVSNSKRMDKTEAELKRGATNYSEAKFVLDGMKRMIVYAHNSPWLQQELARGSISYLFDLDTGTLGGLHGRLAHLEQKGLITPNERAGLSNALCILRVVRRNVDAHTFHNLAVFGAFNRDLDALYLPLVNLLLDIYRRQSKSPQ